MRLIAVSMIRNEADILPDFLGHCAALFDETLVVDHASTDGSAGILAAAAAEMDLSVWRLDQRVKVQSLVMSALAREAVARDADWVFPLDADEFPASSSRDALLARLAGRGPLLNWQWRNLWPGTAARFAACRLDGQHDSLSTGVRKVAVARRLIADTPGFTIGHGSHGAGPRPKGVVVEPALGDLLHMPVRSAARLRLKLEMNQPANMFRPAPGGAQYRRTAERIAQLTAEDGAALRRRFALGYPGIASDEQAARAETCPFAPARTLAGLPAPLPDLDAVMAAEAALRWDALPDAPVETWQLRLEGGRARLVAG